MAKRPTTATLQQALAAYDVWRKKWQEQKDARGIPSRRLDLEDELRVLLDQNEELIFGAMVEQVFNDPYSSTILLGDISPELKEFFKKPGAYVNRHLLEALRDWFLTYFGDHVRVEYGLGGLCLDFS